MQKFATICTITEVIVTLAVALAGWLPTTPETQSVILACLDRPEVFYEFDFFTPGGHSRSKAYCQVDDLLAKYSCLGVLFLGALIGSNMLEIGLHYKLFQEIRKQTNKSAWILSKKDFIKRKR